jgi:hypothetical protein
MRRASVASASLGHHNSQCSSGNKSKIPLHLSKIRRIQGAHGKEKCTKVVAMPNPPIVPGEGLLYRSGTFTELLIVERWAANVWRIKGP